MDNYAEWFAKRLRDTLGDMQQSDLIKIMAENGFETLPGRVSHYFQGRNYPDPPVLAELAKALGVSADYLLGMTEEVSPVADLLEKLAAATGQSVIDKIIKGLPPEKQKQVLQFAEYLLSQEPIERVERNRKIGSALAPLTESERIQIEARKWLASIERTHGLEVRKEVEKVFRSKGIIVNGAT